MPIDKELIEQLVRKDHDAYNTFYLETVDMFYRYVASRYVLSSAAIEDIVSAFYVKFWRVVERYDDAYAFETYMWTVFRNMLKDYFKKQRLQILPDTRDGADEEWDEGHTGSAKHIVLNYIPDEIETIKSWDKPVIAVCRSGARSQQATNFLASNGVDVINGGPWQNVDQHLS